LEGPLVGSAGKFEFLSENDRGLFNCFNCQLKLNFLA
jgi:hypothetical protein